MTDHFSVNWRDTGHWDIRDSYQRLFCIRGKPGAYFVRDERPEPNSGPTRDGFATVDAAMTWICATLMYEANAQMSDEKAGAE